MCRSRDSEGFRRELRPKPFGTRFYGGKLTSSSSRSIKYAAEFPRQETYALIIQMRWAALSIPANITERFRKRGRADKVRFMNIAEGSLEESRYYLILAEDLGYGKTDKLMALLEEVSWLLNAYSKAIATHNF